MSHSFLGDDLVLAAFQDHVGSLVTLGAGRVAEVAHLVHAVAHRERVSVIEEVHLVLRGVAFFSTNETRVLLVEPRPLHVSLALRIVHFVILLTCQL